MQIVIQLSDSVSAAAEKRVRAVADATVLHASSFNGCEIDVQRGDFTCISEGEGHRDAAALFALVNNVIDGGEFGSDEGRTLVPFATGGFAKVLAD